MVLPRSATKTAAIPTVETELSKVGPRTNTTPINPVTNPANWLQRSFSPRTFTAKIETKTGCKLVITAATPAETPLEIAKKTPPR